MTAWLIVASLLASLLLTIRALVHGSWWLMALAAVLSLPFNVVQLAFFLTWLVTCPQIAMAVALRWRAGVAGWWALLKVALAVVLIGGPGTILLHRRLSPWAGPVYRASSCRASPMPPVGNRSAALECSRDPSRGVSLTPTPLSC